MNIMQKRNLDDVAELGVAAWLVVSPFLLGYSARVDATLTAVMVGAILALTTQLAIARPANWEEYSNLVLAAVLIASPFVFGFSAMFAATINAIATGIVLGVLCIVGLVQQRSLEREESMGEGALRPH
jgi:hypothetical protein